MVTLLADARRQAEMNVRIGRIVHEMERTEPYTLVSFAIRRGRTWRSSFAFHLGQALRRLS